jgi:hypothetical protein
MIISIHVHARQHIQACTKAHTEVFAYKHNTASAPIIHKRALIFVSVHLKVREAEDEEQRKEAAEAAAKALGESPPSPLLSVLMLLESSCLC